MMNDMEILEKLKLIFQDIFDNDLLEINMNTVQSDIEDWDSLEQVNIVAAIQRNFGIQFPISIMLKCECIGDIVNNIKILLGGEEDKPDIIKLECIEFAEKNPASSVQSRLYMLYTRAPERLDYNVTFTIRLDGKVDVERLESSLNKCLEINPMLRAQFHLEDKLYYSIRNNAVCPLEIEVLEPFNSADVESIREKAVKNFIRPFKLDSDDLLMRAKLIQYDCEKYILFIDVHHIVIDGSSVKVFMHDLETAYNCGDIHEKKELEYCSFVSWQEQYIKSEEYKEKTEFWRDIFDDDPVICNIADINNVEKEYYTSKAIRDHISDKDTIDALCHRFRCTKNVFFTSIFIIALSRMTYNTKVSFGIAVAGRNSDELQDIVSMFVNNLPVFLEIDNKMSFADLVDAVQDNNFQILQNSDVLYEDIMSFADDKLRSMIDISFRYQKAYYDYLDLDNISCHVEQEMPIHNDIGLFFMVDECDNGFDVSVFYADELYRRETIDSFIQLFIQIKNEVIKAPEIFINDIELCNEQQKQLILNDFNATKTEYPKDKTVVELFEEQVIKTPDNTALVFEDEKLTYAELNARANSLAHKLRELGVKPDDFVAIIADRSIEMICGIYGIIKSGGAYVPIDPTYPEDRISFMLNDCGAKAVLVYTTDSISIDNEIPLIDLGNEEVWVGAPENPETVNRSNDLIYCIYTSGTTGKPKGVLVEHNGIVNLGYYMQNELAVTSSDRVMLFANYIFDGSVWEILMAHINGAALFVPTDEIIKDINQMEKYVINNKISISYFPPAYFEQGNFDLNKYIVTAGSQTRKSVIDKALNSADYINSYGPTEAAICTTNWIVQKGSSENETISIGRPISNKIVYIVNGDTLCGIGVPGELCIAGDGLARGYLNRPELTEEKFVKNPYGEGRMYRSGDLARWLPDGNIEYLGRIDEQVKIRGFRIELGEIESRIREIENIKDCAVIARADSTGDKAIYAYYTSDSEVSVSVIRDTLSESLPEYMVPGYMMQIESIPVTRNGKLDKRALPEIEARATREYIAPRNETEETICNIFAEILNIEQVGVKDSFFELGGHSLRATRLVNRIEAETGTRIALKEVFAHPTVEQLAVLAGAESEEYIPIPKAEDKEYYPMSSAQKRTYLIQQMQPESVTYNMPQNMKLTGEVYPEKFREALQGMTDRHEILRTQFLMIDGEPVQKILDHIDADFEYVTSNEPDEKLIAEYMKPFDLSTGKTVRAKLVDKGEYHLLMMDMHHIVGDGMSMNTFTREFMALYNVEKLEPLTHQFKDYSEWMRSRDLSGQEEYWKKQFEEEIPVLDMPTDYPRPQEQSYAGTMTGSVLDEKLSGSVKEIMKKTGATEYMVFLAAAMVTLSKYSRQEDIVIGSPISGRTHSDTESMLGMFVNTLAMRGRPEKNKSFNEFLKEVKETCLKAYENQEYPFEELVEAVDVQRDMSRNPLFDVMLVMQNNESTEMKLGEAESEAAGFSSTIAKFDLTFNIAEVEGKYGIALEYCTDLFKKETAERLLSHFIEILKEVTENGEKKLGEIEMVTEEERSLILNDFNATETEYPRDKTVVELFEEQVVKTPDNTALVFEDEKLIYAELNARANSLAHKLREMGVKPDDFVAIIADRSIEMICGIYGIIKSGGAYVPIDPTYPEDRISFMLEDCAPKAVLVYTTESITVPDEIPVIDLGNEEVWEGAPENPETVNKPSDLIYCIYTSGTTGKPKGVMLEHHGLVNLKYFFVNRMGISESDRILQFANYIFDASVWEMTMALLNGAEMICVPKSLTQTPEEFSEYCRKNGVTVATLPPNYYLQEGVELDLRLLITAGSESGKDVLKKAEKQGYINAYGPTETTICASIWRRPEEWKEKTTPIGVPIDNFQNYIMNGDALCGIGVPGELCISGDGLARGYLNRPELTEGKFVKNPYGEGRMYRSGDLARWLPDGNIEYLGRIDEQVKIRGFRIELGEIESRIREIENIKDCAVIARADSTGDKAIYAYYTSDEEVSVSVIRDTLSESLPEYMVPGYMMQIEAIPVTRNGKLDKRALPEIEARATREYIAPRNETEEKICNIFAEILNVEQVGVKDSFFELGGHSLRATRLVNRIEAETGTRIALKEVFANPTVEQLAVLAGAESEEYIPIPKAEEKEYYPMSSAQKRTYLIHQMQPESVTYNMPQNMKLTGEVYPEKLREALQGMTDRHEILRTQFLMVDGEPVQKILEHIEADFEYVVSNEYDEKLIAEYMKPFDLSTGKTVRAKLVNKGEYHLLMMDMHHIVGDGMSTNTFTREFMALYNGEKLEPLTHQFKDYSEWMRSRDLSGQEEYWKKQFEEEIPVLDMPTDYPRPQEQSYAGTMTGAMLDEKLSGSVKEIMKQTGATEYMVFLATAMVTLSKYSRQEDIVIGSPISGRTHRDTESMLGMFVNTLAMRGRPEKNKSFDEFLKEVKDICLKAYENQEYPFEELVEAVEVQRDMSRNPLFDVMLVMHNNESTEMKLGEAESEAAGFSSTIAKFDLTFNIAEVEGKYGIALEYCTDLFKKETAERLLSHFIEILKEVTSNVEKKLGEIEMVTEEERSLILNDFNATETEYPRDKTVVELFEEQVERTPDNTALVFEDEKLTYAELNRRANSLAHKLREMGVKPDDFVAIIADRSIEMICGIYGIIKSGGAYVPIDPTYPEDRISFMLEDCAPKAVLAYTTESITVPTEIPVIDLGNEEVWEGAPENPETVNKPSDLIYCIYTSGTTGKPKGVLIEHKSVVNFICPSKYNSFQNDLLSKCESVYSTNRITFDITVQEIFLTLCNGKRVIISSNHVGIITKNESDSLGNNIGLITTPSKLRATIKENEDYLDRFALIMIGAEKLTLDLVSNVWTKTEAEIINGYGPTESTCGVLYYNCSADNENIPIGKPISNTKVYILNSNNLCGIGVPGELCIAGDGLARGYLNRPELTAEKFVKNPYGEGRIYRSGDLARWLPDGNIEYLGRIDEQVKVRGFRIELGEIESRIREIEKIKDCAVIVRADSTGDKAIYAYYTSDEEVSVSEIRDKLSKSLPEYMVPGYMMQIESIPVTRNGKLDKKALPEIEARAVREYIAPKNDIQKIICEAFEEILSIDKISIKCNLYELGGDSIKAIRIISKIREKKHNLEIKYILQGLSIEILSAYTTKEETAQSRKSVCSGELMPTPIISEFMNWDLKKPEHFNQTVFIPAERLSHESWKSISKKIIFQHDILRLVCKNGKFIVMEPEKFDMNIVDFYVVDNSEDPYNEVENVCNQYQESFDLENGPLFKMVVFEIGKDTLLFMVAHHLVIDRVSWNIILSDFEALQRQIIENTELTLPEKTASFIEWSELVNEYSSSDKIASEIPYWNSISYSYEGYEIFNVKETDECDFRIKHFVIEVDTETSITDIANSFNVNIQDLLLTALGITIRKIGYTDKETILLEGNGRYELHKTIDIYRTVGWFTNVYPISIYSSGDIQDDIITVKETIRNIPNNGIAYGILKQKNMLDKATNDLIFSFNFLGTEKAETVVPEKIFSAGTSIAPENKLFGIINFNIINVDNSIIVDLLYDTKKVEEKYITEIQTLFTESFNEVIDYCVGREHGIKTASDLSDSSISSDELDYINGLF